MSSRVQSTEELEEEAGQTLESREQEEVRRRRQRDRSSQDDDDPAESDVIGASDRAAREDRSVQVEEAQQQEPTPPDQGIEEGGGQGQASVTLQGPTGQEFTFTGSASDVAARAEQEFLDSNPDFTAEDIRFVQSESGVIRAEFTATGREAASQIEAERIEQEAESGQGQIAAVEREFLEEAAGQVGEERTTGEEFGFGLIAQAEREALQLQADAAATGQEFGAGRVQASQRQALSQALADIDIRDEFDVGGRAARFRETAGEATEPTALESLSRRSDIPIFIPTAERVSTEGIVPAVVGAQLEQEGTTIQEVLDEQAEEFGRIADEIILERGGELLGESLPATALLQADRGAADLFNVPGTASGLKDVGELGIFLGVETAAGRGGAAIDDFEAAGREVVAGIEQQFREQPLETGARLGGSLIASVLAFGAAGRAGQAIGRARTARRFRRERGEFDIDAEGIGADLDRMIVEREAAAARRRGTDIAASIIQPGEEILGRGGFRVTRAVAGERVAQRLFPNQEPLIFSEEFALRQLRRAGAGARRAFEVGDIRGEASLVPKLRRINAEIESELDRADRAQESSFESEAESRRRIEAADIEGVASIEGVDAEVEDLLAQAEAPSVETGVDQTPGQEVGLDVDQEFDPEIELELEQEIERELERELELELEAEAEQELEAELKLELEREQEVETGFGLRDRRRPIEEFDVLGLGQEFELDLPGDPDEIVGMDLDLDLEGL